MNLNELRKITSVARVSGGEIIITVEQAEEFIREAEQMHGGSRDNYLISKKCDQLRSENEVLRKELAEQFNKPVTEDKVKNLLPKEDS